MQESPKANPKLESQRSGRKQKRLETQGLLVDSQRFQLTYHEDELKSHYSGAVICKACHSSFARLRSDASSILIVGTEVMLHQVQFIIRSRLSAPIIGMLMWKRRLIKLVYDRTDRAIRVSAHWYQSHIAGSIQILLITNNRESKKNAIELLLQASKFWHLGLSSETVRFPQQPNSLDLVAIPTSLDILKGELDDLEILMRQRQIERGALTLESIEVKFQMDAKTHDPLDIGIYPIREADLMIEEFILACNFSVAERILKHFPSCFLLRCAMLILRGI